MSYLCDIYENIRVLFCCLLCVSVFFAFISPAFIELSLVKKVFSFGFYVFLLSVIVLVFLPSKEFVCGA